ncbi:MAG: hypothetical protein ACQCN3_02320 [Candidatus Bathyarchaeia archaeon]|jgi:hypothetical protein
MTDRKSSTPVGKFTLSTDRDHRGRFRGSQAMSAEFRGWHYHIEHPTLTQEEIFAYLSKCLQSMNAEKVKEQTFIGVVEATPKKQECWRLGDASTVLWISGKTGSLHVEANKRTEYAKSILTKPVLVKLLKQYNIKQPAQTGLSLGEVQ